MIRMQLAGAGVNGQQIVLQASTQQQNQSE